jgi:hypothetical protein
MERKKKQFKDTAVGRLFNKVGDLLPENGVLGVLKEVIDTDEELTPEQEEKVLERLNEAYRLEVEDRNSARQREVGVAQTGKTDWLMMLTGLVGLGSFGFVIYATVYVPTVLENDLFVHLMGMIEGVVVSNLFAYYFGTSQDKK